MIGGWIKRGWRHAGAVVLLSAAGLPAAAQDDTRSVFEMFFLPGDIVGITVTWLLIIMSVTAMALIMRHVNANKRKAMMPPAAFGEYEDLLAEKQFREAIERASDDKSAFGQVVHAALSEAANGYGAMERAIEEEADLIGARRIRAVELLAVMGAVGPMIGLFGTVYGMIAAFDTIVKEGGTPDPASLAAGISTALVTTFWGLIVGIPSVASAAMIRNKIDETMVEIVIQAEMLIAPFSPSAKKAASGGGGATRPTAKPQAAPRPDAPSS